MARVLLKCTRATACVPPRLTPFHLHIHLHHLWAKRGPRIPTTTHSPRRGALPPACRALPATSVPAAPLPCCCSMEGGTTSAALGSRQAECGAPPPPLAPWRAPAAAAVALALLLLWVLVPLVLAWWRLHMQQRQAASGLGAQLHKPLRTTTGAGSGSAAGAAGRASEEHAPATPVKPEAGGRLLAAGAPPPAAAEDAAEALAAAETTAADHAAAAPEAREVVHALLPDGTHHARQ